MKPAKGGPRHIKIAPPNKAQIEALRADAYALVDFPELLNQPEWRLAAILIARAFIAQNLQRRRPGPQEVATLIDESIDYQLKQGIPAAQAVRSARAAIAEMLKKSHTGEAVKVAHLRHGKRRGTARATATKKLRMSR